MSRFNKAVVGFVGVLLPVSAFAGIRYYEADDGSSRANIVKECDVPGAGEDEGYQSYTVDLTSTQIAGITAALADDEVPELRTRVRWLGDSGSRSANVCYEYTLNVYNGDDLVQTETRQECDSSTSSTAVTCELTGEEDLSLGFFVEMESKAWISCWDLEYSTAEYSYVGTTSVVVSY